MAEEIKKGNRLYSPSTYKISRCRNNQYHIKLILEPLTYISRCSNRCPIDPFRVLAHYLDNPFNADAILSPVLLVMALLTQWLQVASVPEKGFLSAVQIDVIIHLHPSLHPSTIKIFQMVKMGHGIKIFIKCAHLIEPILPI